MTEVRTITLKTAGHDLSLKLSFDPLFQADLNTQYYFDRATPPEPELIHLLLRVLRPGDRAVDAGANIGFFTLVMAALVGKTGWVNAVEPGLNNISKLRANIQLNEFTNVIVTQAALWNETGRKPLHITPDSGENCLANVDHAVGLADVETMLLDTLCRNDIRVIKIDVEGAEYEVLEGAKVLLRSRPHYVVVEMNETALNRFGHTREDIRTFMHDRGYRMFVLHPNGEFPTFVPRNVPIRSDRFNLNVLFSTIDRVTQAWPEIQL